MGPALERSAEGPTTALLSRLTTTATKRIVGLIDATTVGSAIAAATMPDVLPTVARSQTMEGYETGLTDEADKGQA